MTPPIVQQLRDAAAAIHDERVSRGHCPSPWPRGPRDLASAGWPCPACSRYPAWAPFFGLGMAALVVSMWRGHCTPCLPQRVAELELPRQWAQRVLVGLASAYALAGRHAKARLSRFAMSGRRSATALTVGGLMAAIVVMPIPFGNLLPAVALMFIGLGLVFR